MNRQGGGTGREISSYGEFHREPLDAEAEYRLRAVRNTVRLIATPDVSKAGEFLIYVPLTAGA
jgi:hypothetical protein